MYANICLCMNCVQVQSVNLLTRNEVLFLSFKGVALRAVCEKMKSVEDDAGVGCAIRDLTKDLVSIGT